MRGVLTTKTARTSGTSTACSTQSTQPIVTIVMITRQFSPTPLLMYELAPSIEYCPVSVRPRAIDARVSAPNATLSRASGELLSRSAAARNSEKQ